MRILFLDISCPSPYDSETLETKPQGGTESSVTRIAEGLVTRGHDVTVAQHNRDDVSAVMPGAVYCGIHALDANYRPDAIVCLRTSKLIPFAKDRWPSAKLFLHSHDFNQQEFVRDYPILKGSGVKILAVSRHHKNAIADAFLSQIGFVEGLTVDFVYNPIADDLSPDSTPVDPNKLIFFSSPHKGLEHTLNVFSKLRSIDPAFTLTVANPGYLPSLESLPAGVFCVGALPHPEVLAHVRSAFCCFHLNPVFPETFGLVHAEAAAVGTPVLAGPLGANREVIGDSRCILNVQDEQAVIDRLLLWKKQGRPEVKVNPEFRLSKILTKWEALINV